MAGVDKIELLAPAGSMEKLKFAIHFGADAVYLGGNRFSLRSANTGFQIEEMAEAITYAHDRHVRVYITCNTFPRPEEIPSLTTMLQALAAVGPDGIIVADPGVVALTRTHAPSIPIHISTQANTTHAASALFWKSQGAVRVNTAREMTLDGISHMTHHVDVQVESFVHGAMCIAYSGRCLLSAAMTGRSANEGQCAHPCRWQYALAEAYRPDEYMPIVEDHHGSYVFNSRDLCMIDHLPAMMAAGITSYKIEGRMKGIHYLGTVVNVYRQALDRCIASPRDFSVDGHWHAELATVNRRGYSTGFYLDEPEETMPNQAPPNHSDTRRFVANVISSNDEKSASVVIRNKLCLGDPVEILQPGRAPAADTVSAMWDADGKPVTVAQPNAEVRIALSTATSPMDLIRRMDTPTAPNDGD